MYVSVRVLLIVVCNLVVYQIDCMLYTISTLSTSPSQAVAVAVPYAKYTYMHLFIVVIILVIVLNFLLLFTPSSIISLAESYIFYSLIC